MRYWQEHPELYDEIITNALPEPWKTRVIDGEIELEDVPEDIFHKAAEEGEADYWAGLADAERTRRKYEPIEKEYRERQEQDSTDE